MMNDMNAMVGEECHIYWLNVINNTFKSSKWNKWFIVSIVMLPAFKHEWHVQTALCFWQTNCMLMCCCRVIKWTMSASGAGCYRTRRPSLCPDGFCLEECVSPSQMTVTHPPSTRPWLALHTVSRNPRWINVLTYCMPTYASEFTWG